MPKISPHAVVAPTASIADDVEIGPFCVIGPDVTLGSGCRLVNSVSILGHTRIGKNNVFHPNCVIGGDPQDEKFGGEKTYLEIGDNNHIREAVTIHTGTSKGGGVTRVGNNNLLMINCHLGHDVQLGDNCILANNVMIAGHVVIGNNVAMMGGAAAHHFVTIGEYAYIAGYSKLHHDVPPYVKIDGSDQVRGLNVVGLRRAGVSDQDIEALENLTLALFYAREKPFSQTLADFDTANGVNPYVKQMISFLRRRDQGKHGRYLEAHRAG